MTTVASDLPTRVRTAAAGTVDVIAGELRLIIADHDMAMQPGEVAEFDTRGPHWPAGDRPVEIPDGLAITSESDGTTVLRGSVVNQAALHGLLQKRRDVGIP